MICSYRIFLQWRLIVTRYILFLFSIITCKLILKTPVGELINKLYCIVGVVARIMSVFPEKVPKNP